MRLFHFGKDGGKDSVVWGFWPIEIKSLFSICLLCFENGSREEFHNHAFNSISWLLKGQLNETFLNGKGRPYTPSLKPIFTPRNTFHKVSSEGRSWVLSFRGPWRKRWMEYLPKTKEFIYLENGRVIKDRWKVG